MKTKSNIIFISKLTFIFILLAVPFKVMELIKGFTEIRPANALNMLFGLMFGIQGALACAFGNTLADIIGGTLAISSWAGFVANFLGTYSAYIIWYKMIKEEPNIKNMKQVSAFIVISMVVGLLISLIVTFGVTISYDVDSLELFKTVLINTVAFSVVLGMPSLIVLKEVFHIKYVTPNNRPKRSEK